MTGESEVEQIRHMLSLGHLFIADPVTGYHRSPYAHCPNDGSDSSVTHVDRSGWAKSITRVVFHCPVCSRQFDAGPEDMFLR
jgi:hypothetical protein